MADYHLDFTKATPDTPPNYVTGSYTVSIGDSITPVYHATNPTYIAEHWMGVLVNDFTSGAEIRPNMFVPKGLAISSNRIEMIQYNTDFTNAAHTKTDLTVASGGSWGSYTWYDLKSNGGSSGATTLEFARTGSNGCNVLGFYVDVTQFVGNPDIGFTFNNSTSWLRYVEAGKFSYWTAALASGHELCQVWDFKNGIWYVEIWTWDNATTTDYPILVRLGSSYADGNYTANTKIIRVACIGSNRYTGTKNNYGGLFIPNTGTSQVTATANTFAFTQANWAGSTNNGVVWGGYYTGIGGSTGRYLKAVTTTTSSSGEWLINQSLMTGNGNGQNWGPYINNQVAAWIGGANSAKTSAANLDEYQTGAHFHPHLQIVRMDGVDLKSYYFLDEQDSDVYALPTGLNLTSQSYRVEAYNGSVIFHRLYFDESTDQEKCFRKLAYGTSGQIEDVKADFSSEDAFLKAKAPHQDLTKGYLLRTSDAYVWNGANIVSMDGWGGYRIQDTVEVWQSEDATTGSKTVTWTTVKRGLMTEPQVEQGGFATETTTASASTRTTASDSTVASIISGANWMKITEDSTAGSTHFADINIDGYNSGGQLIGCFFKAGSANRGIGIKLSRGGDQGTVHFDPVNDDVYVDSTSTLERYGMVKFGTAGYFVWIQCNYTVTTASQVLRIHLLNTSSALDGTNDSYNGDGTSYIYVQGFQEHNQRVPFTSYIKSTGTKTTRTAETLTNFYSNDIEAKGKIFGISHSPIYPKNGNTLFGSDQAAGAGEFEVQADYDTNGKLTLRTDDGTTVVDELNATAVTALAQTEVQIEVKGSDGDQKTYCWQDDTQLGTAATHGIADTDILDGEKIVVEGFGGVVHKFAITDADY